MPTFEATRPDGSTHIFVADDLETAQRDASDSSVRELETEDTNDPDAGSEPNGSYDPADDGEFRTVSTPNVEPEENE